jgi:drug/metabolite transporter (DMT)-like permease
MVLIGSSTAPAARFAVRELPVELVPLVRFGVSGLCLLPVVGWCGSDLRRVLREDGRRLLAAAFCCVPLNQTFFLNATRLTTTAHVALIYAAVPLVVLLLAAAAGQERLRADRLAGVVASVFGVAVIGLDGLYRGDPAGPTAPAMARGDLLLVGAVIAWGAYLTLSKPLVARHGPLTTLAGTFLLGTALEVPVALVTLPGWISPPPASAAAWWGLAYLTLVATLCSLALQNLALRRLDASQVATFGNAAPLLTVLWGIWLFGETVSPALVLGGVLTLGGIFWTGHGKTRTGVVLSGAGRPAFASRPPGPAAEPARALQ